MSVYRLEGWMWAVLLGAPAGCSEIAEVRLGRARVGDCLCTFVGDGGGGAADDRRGEFCGGGRVDGREGG